MVKRISNSCHFDWGIYTTVATSVPSGGSLIEQYYNTSFSNIPWVTRVANVHTYGTQTKCFHGVEERQKTLFSFYTAAKANTVSHSWLAVGI